MSAAAPAIKFNFTVNDRLLQANVAAMSRATGKTLKEQTFITFKGMVRDGINVTAPSSQRAHGSAAKAAGEGAILRDLARMGFVPVQIKGHRTIRMAFGRPITPVTVPTKLNPAFSDPEGHHSTRLRAKHNGKVTRGGRQAFYVDQAKFRALRSSLLKRVGELAGGWAAAALDLGVVVPAWIRRHWALGRGSQVIIQETPNRIIMRVTNHFPDTAAALADQTRRQIAFIKQGAINKLKRQLPFVLKARMREAKRN